MVQPIFRKTKTKKTGNYVKDILQILMIVYKGQEVS